MKTVQIYGNSCEKAETLYVLAQEIIHEHRCDALVLNITDPRVWEHHGALMLPALAVDDLVVVEGRVPSKHELAFMLKSHGIVFNDKKDEEDDDIPEHLEKAFKEDNLHVKEEEEEVSDPSCSDCGGGCPCGSGAWQKWLLLLLIVFIILILVQLFNSMDIPKDEGLPIDENENITDLPVNLTS